MAQVAEKTSPLVAALERRPQGGPRWLQALRDRGASRFTKLGVPTVRDEEWRFTNVAPIASTEFGAAPAGGAAPDVLARTPYGGSPVRIVLVNGRVDRSLSTLDGLPPSVVLVSLADAVASHADLVEQHLGQLADIDGRSFAALNTAFLDDGVCLYVPDGVVLETPIHVISLGYAAGEPAMAHPRLLAVVGKSSRVQLVETYVSDGAVTFTNAVSEVIVGENATVDHYKVQQEQLDCFHVASLHVRMARSATFSSHSFSLGGRLVRNDALATLGGEGGECTLNGLYLADGDRLVDNHTTIDHAMPHCASHEVYKGILGGKARAVFNGKIIVRQDAQKTDAKQTNRALLLSDEATINTKPQLEIFADDVKCTHGAAIGQLDDDAIFYLRARGLTYADARDMLIHAFAGEILDRVRIEPLKTALEAELFAQLARDLAEADSHRRE
ncbi:MAG TPA: Fe-S cluster assembly protein SufD [Vicinamibacterales bacterium]|nr:Fe-S cluster assembly protein SufD [Vicinamibacterales bacterium]